MNNKLIIIFSLILLLLMITGVSANDCTTTDGKICADDTQGAISSTDENCLSPMGTSEKLIKENVNSTEEVLQITSDSEILKEDNGNSFSDLNTLIKGSEEGSVLILDKNYEFVTGIDNKFGDAGITIKKTLTIDGNNNTINAKGYKLFTVSANNVILKNINIFNSSDPIMWKGETGKINNLNFVNCSNGVTFKTNDLQINNSKFENCVGQVINIENLKDALIYNTKFINCSSTGNTIITMSFTDNIVFSRCDFIQCYNTGSDSGGVIFTEFSTAVFENCRFNYNSGVFASSIYSPRSIITINKCNFTNNVQTSSDNGGGVINSGGDLVYISNSRFENNRGRIGVLYLTLDSTVSNSVFINNLATSSYGIIYFASNGGSIINCEFNVNQYVVEAPLFYIPNNVRLISIDNCIIQGNRVNYIASILSTDKDSKISFDNTKIYNNFVKDYLFNINSDNTINFNLECLGNVNDAGVTPSTYDSSRNIRSFVLYDELWANDVGGGNGRDRNHPTTLKNASMNVKVMGTVHLLSKTYQSGSIGAITGIFKLIGENKYNTNIKSGGNNGINVRYVSNLTTSASIHFNNHYVVDNIVIHDFDPLSAIVNTFDCVFSNWEFSQCSANSAYFRLAHSSKVYMINITFTDCEKSGFVWFNGGCYHNEVRNLTCINHANPINGLIRIGLERSAGNGYENMNNIIDGVYIYNSAVARVISREITDTTGKIQYFETCYNTINNINIYNTNALNYVISLYPNDSLTNVMMYNVNSAGDIIHTAANSTIKNINLTKVTCQGSLFGSNDGDYGFNPINIKMENITVNNAKATYAFNPDANSQLNLIFFKNTNFTSYMGILSNNVILSNSDFKDFTGNIRINGDKTKVSNTNFTNGKLNSISENGGAIELVKGDNFIIDGCIFTGNVAYNGGAIYIRSVSNSSYIFNSKFYNNTVTNNGGAVFVSSGISYYIDSNTKSTFGTVSRINDLYDANTIPLMHIVWVSSTGNGNGSYANPASFTKGYELVEPYGYIYFKGETDVITSSAPYIFNKPGLTLIGNKSTTINNISFIIEEYATSFSIYNLIFNGCTDYSSITWGGKDGVIDRCTFKNNGGENIICGAAIQINAINLNIADSIFINNIAGNDEGGYGGAVYCDAGGLTINNCNFSQNSVYYGGSHIYLTENANDILINNSNFSNGKINALNGLGSAIYILSESNIIIDKSNFSNNVAVNGGALKIAGIITTLHITNNVFSTNNVTDNGGAIALMSSTINNLIMSNNTYKFNTANRGGAIYSNARLVEEHSIFNNNTANYGGALFIDSGAHDTDISKCDFIKNKATFGGAVYMEANDVSLISCNFINNSAVNGSAIFIVNGKSGCELKDCNFNDNNATTHGTVYLTGSTNLKLTNNLFVNNGPAGIIENYYILAESNYKSLLVYVSPNGNGTGLTIDDSTSIDKVWDIADNNAKIIFLSGEYEFSQTINNMNYVFVGRDGVILKRKDSKSILVLENGARVTIENATMAAGIDVAGDCELNLNNVTFTSTSNLAGGIYYASGSRGNIENSFFIDSTLLGDDHIITANGYLIISGSEFKNNDIIASAIYYSSTGSGSIHDCNFSENKASNLRNINVTNRGSINVYDNIFDVNVNYNISDSIYGSLAYINGTFDAGTNTNINIRIVINDTKTSAVVSVDPVTHKFSFDVSGKLNVGRYNLTVSSNDANTYIVNYLSDYFQVTKANVTINDISGISVSYGDNDTITITGFIANNIVAGNNYTGQVSVIIAENCAVNSTVNADGSFSVQVNVKQFNVGVYPLNITIVGNDNYNGTSKKFDNYLTVDNATIAIVSIDKIVVDYGVDYVVVNGTLNSTKFGVNYTGMITVTINDLSNKTEVVNGVFSVRISNSTIFRPGNYTIVASGEAISNYNAIAAYTLVEGLVVNKAVPEFIISSPSIGYGENATIYFSLPSDATGRLLINASDKYIVELDEVYGKNNVTIVLPVSGTYNINATYFGDDNYCRVSVNSTLFVERPRSSINISVEDVFVGSDVLINFTINSAVSGKLFDDASGILMVYVGSSFYTVNVTGGKANLTVPNLSIGSYNVVVIYDGDENYAGSNGYDKFNVKGYETDLVISLDSNVVLVGSNVIVTVNVNETINGDPIYLYIDNVLYNILLANNGSVVFNVTGLKYGVHNITAVFATTSSFNGVSNETNITILKNDPRFNAEAVASSNLDVSVIIDLAMDATGIINITYKGVVISSIDVVGSQTVNLGHFDSGNHTFYVTYSGDDKYYNASGVSTVEVGKISDYSMNITSSVIVRNQDATIFVNLPSEFKNNGTVNLTINGEMYCLDLVNGSVNKTVSTVGFNNITVVATYSGYGNYASRTISKVFTIEPISDYDFVVNVTGKYVGDNVIISIDAPIQFNNVNFTITINGMMDNVSIVDGRGCYSIDDISLGHYVVVVTSVTNEYYIAEDETVEFDIVRKDSFLNVTGDAIIDVGEDYDVIMELPEDATGNLTLIVGSKIINYTNIVGTQVDSISDLPEGNYIVVVRYSGDRKYLGAEKEINLVVNKIISTIIVVVENETSLKAMGNYGVNITVIGENATGSIILDNNGVISRVELNNGSCNFNINSLQAGEYYINVTYLGNYKYAENGACKILNIARDVSNPFVNATVVDVYVGQDAIFSVNMTNSFASGSVDVYVNGKFNKTVMLSDAGAIIVLSDLSNGTYAITVVYSGDNNYYSTVNATLNVCVSKSSVIPQIYADSEIVFGNDAYIIITLDCDDADGTVVVYVDGVENQTIELEYAMAEVIVSGLSVGNHTIGVKYNGNDKYNVSEIVNTNITVDKAGSKIIIEPVVNVTYGSDVVVGFGIVNKTKIIVEIYNAITFENITSFELDVGDDYGIVTIKSLVPGDYYIIVSNDDVDSSYEYSFDSVEFNVGKADSKVTIMPISNVTYDDNVFIYFDIENKTNIEVEIYNLLTGDDVDFDLDELNNVVIISKLLPGSYEVFIYNNDSDLYNGNGDMAKFHVDRLGSNIALVGPIEDITYGENLTVYYEVENKTEIFAILINNVTGDIIKITDNVFDDHLVISDIEAGEYGIVIINNASDIYQASYIIDSFNVYKAGSLVTIEPIDDVVVGGDVVIYYHVENETDIEISITDEDGTLFDYVVENHIITVKGLSVGKYVVYIHNGESKNYAQSEAMSPFNIIKFNPVINVEVTSPISAFDRNVMLFITVLNATGVVQVLIDGEMISQEGYNLVNGSVNVSVPYDLLTAGIHSYTVSYGGDDNNTMSVVSNSFMVNKALSNITIIIENKTKIDALGSFNVTIVVADDKGDMANGFVVVNDNGRVFTVDLEDGVCNYLASNLRAGDYVIDVVYNGDDNFFNATGVREFYVSKADARFKEVETVTPVIEYGYDGIFRVVMDYNSTGNVTIFVDDVLYGTFDLDDSYANVTIFISGLKAGKHNFTVSYNGDGNFNPVSGFIRDAIVVNRITPVVVVDGPGVVSFGDEAEFIVTVYADVDMIAFDIWIDGVLYDVVGPREWDSNVGYFMVAPNWLPIAKDYNITVQYLGNENYTASENVTHILTVSKANSEVIIGSIDNMVCPGDVSVNYTVVNATMVNVVVMYGDGMNITVIYNDTFVAEDSVITKSIKLSNLTVGNYGVIVVNYGSDNYDVGVNATGFEVFSDVAADVDISFPEGSTDAVFSITVSRDAGGLLLVDIGGKHYYAPVVNGTASVAVPGLDPGNYTVVVAYTGDGRYIGSNVTKNITVPSNLPDNAFVIPETGDSDSPITYAINLPGDATGYFTVEVDGTKYATCLVDGSASIVVPLLSEGDYDVVVGYSGDGRYSSASLSSTLSVLVPVYRISLNSDVVVFYSANAYYKVLVTKDGGAAVGVSVVFRYDGKTYTVKTDGNGYAILKLDTNVKVKSYDVTAEYKGIKVSNKVTIKHIIKAGNKKVRKSKKVTKVKVSLKKVDGKVLKGKKLKIKFKGKTYTVKTNKKGVAIWKVKKSVVKKLKVGKKYKYRVTYGRDVVTKKLIIKK